MMINELIVNVVDKVQGFNFLVSLDEGNVFFNVLMVVWINVCRVVFISSVVMLV